VEYNFTASIPGYSGHDYQLQYSDAVTGNWFNIGAPQSGSGVAFNFTNVVSATNVSRYYRIQISP
ncbi:MAG: hypothetical protein RLY20_2915, partial [Verrucomicrobiota bacterium]|jgi:hypothetical protein